MSGYFDDFMEIRGTPYRIGGKYGNGECTHAKNRKQICCLALRGGLIGVFFSTIGSTYTTPGTPRAPLEIPPVNIGGLLTDHARHRPERLAVVFDGCRLSYAQFNARVNRLANALLANGLTRGDKLATVLPNCLELLELYWAVAKTGLVIVPLSPLLGGRALAGLAVDSDATFVFADAGLPEVAAEMREHAPQVQDHGWILTGEPIPARLPCLRRAGRRFSGKRTLVGRDR